MVQTQYMYTALSLIGKSSVQQQSLCGVTAVNNWALSSPYWVSTFIPAVALLFDKQREQKRSSRWLPIKVFSSDFTFSTAVFKTSKLIQPHWKLIKFYSKTLRLVYMNSLYNINERKEDIHFIGIRKVWYFFYLLILLSFNDGNYSF